RLSRPIWANRRDCYWRAVGSSNGGFTSKGRRLRSEHGAGYAARYYSALRVLAGGWGTSCDPVVAPLGRFRNSVLCGGTHHTRGDAKEWRILVSSESITGGSSLHSGILLCQKLTTPQVSTNICASG